MKQKILMGIGAFLMLLLGTRANAQISYVIDSVIPINATDANLYLTYTNHTGTTMLSPRYDTSMALTRLEPAKYLTTLDTNGQMVFLLDSCVPGELHYARVTFFGDSAGFNFTNVVTFTMSCNPVSVSDNMPASLIIGQPVVANATASGGTSPYTYSVAGLMTNVVIDTATGVYGGAANVQASVTYTLIATDADGCSASFTNSVNSICNTQTVSSTLPTTLVAGQNVSGASVATSNGTSPYTYSWSAVNGINLSSSGNFSGAPLAIGPQTYTVTSIDSAMCQATGVFTTTISCASATLTASMPSTLSVGDDVAGYSAALNGGTGQATYSWAGGTITGASLNSLTGAFTGTVTTPGVYTYTVTGTDSLNCQTSQVLTTTVSCPTPTFVSTLPLNLVVGGNYTDSVAASGQNPPYAYAWSGEPATLNLAANQITGTVTVAGVSTTTYVVTDNFGCQSIFVATYTASCPPISIGGLADDTVGNFHLEALLISGGTPPYAASASALPPVWNLANDTVSGFATAFGIFTPTLSVTDTYGCQAVLNDTVQIFCNTWTTTSVGNGITGVFYADTIKSSDPSVTYSLIAGQVPTGTILQMNGAINGTPTAAGTYTFTVLEINQYGCMQSSTHTIVITCPTLSLTTTMPDTVYPGQNIVAQAAASGGTAPYNWLAFTGNPVPTGTIVPTTGVVTTSVTATGVYIYDYNVVDANSCPGTLTDTVWSICSGFAVNWPFPDTIAIGSALNYTVTVLDSLSASHTYTVSGNFIAGGSFAPSGITSGTANQNGTFSFTVTATNSWGCTAIASGTVVVLCDTLAINPLVNNWIIGVAGSYTMSGSGGTAPFSWSITGLPANLSLTDSTISGTPLLNGIYPVVITRSDVYNCQVVSLDTIVVDSLLWIHLDSIGSITATGALAYLSYRDNNDPNAYAFVGYGVSSITTYLPNQPLPLGDGQLVFTLTGLLPGTTYIVGGRAVDAPSGLIFSNNLTFTTKPTGPIYIASNVANILPNSATISVQVNTGGANATVRLYCDNNPVPTTLYQQVTSVSGWLAFNVSGLAAASTAYYYVIVLNAYGTDTSQIMSFVTPAYNVVATLQTYTCGSKITAIANVYSNDPGGTVQLRYEQGWQLSSFASQTPPIVIGIMSGTIAVSSPNLSLFQPYAFSVKARTSTGVEKMTDTATCIVTNVTELEALAEMKVWSYGKTVRVASPVACELTLTDYLGREVLFLPIAGGSEESFEVAIPGVYLYTLRLGEHKKSDKLLITD